MNSILKRLLVSCLKPAVIGVLGFAALPLHAQTLTQRWSNLVSDSAYVNLEGKIVKTRPDGQIITASNATKTYDLDDILIIKSDASTGAKIWQRSSNSPVGFGDFVTGLAIDGNGDVVVVGGRNDLSSYVPSFFAAKYSGADGTLLWQRVFKANLNDYFVGVAVDSQNDVVAVGTTRTNDSSPISSDIITYKFASATGETRWLNQFTTLGSSSTTTDAAKAMTLDAAGNVYVTGYGDNRGSYQAVTLKLAAADGSLLWNKVRLDTGGSSGEDIAVDASGNVIVACSTTQGHAGFRVVKYQGSDGTQLWVNLRQSANEDAPTSLGIDPAGDVVVTGYTYAGTANDDILTQKISGSTGSTLWTRTYDGGITSAGLIKDDNGSAVRFDPAGNPVVAGYSNNTSGNGPDTMILKYASATGATLVQQRIAVSTGDDFPATKDSLDVGPGHITVTGRAYATGGTNKAFVFRLNDPANPAVISRAPGQVGSTTVQVGARVNPNGSATNLRYVYGISAATLNQSTADKAMGNGFAAVESQDSLTGLQPSTTYFYQARAIGNGQTVQGEILQFTTLSNNANLASLGVSTGALNPSFSPSTTGYSITLPPTATVMSVTPTAAHPAATLTVNGTQLTSGATSAPVPLPVGNTAIDTVVTAQDTTVTRTYSVTVTRMPEKLTFSSATDVPVRAPGFSGNGLTADLVLNFAPSTGTNLTVVDNTGVAFIAGRFSNLAHGQEIILHYGGASYPYVVNYYGGDGNDLVLVWAHNKIYSWGYNSSGQLGLGNTTNATIPIAIPATGALAGKTIFSIVSGGAHSLALCSDGSLFTWGFNQYGQLGNGTNVNSSVPVNITSSGALAGKSVIAISAGPSHSYALCADGSLLGWGRNLWGVLGDGTMSDRNLPAMAQFTGFLTGKRIVSVVADIGSCQALCSDGSIAGWGINTYGQLGSTAPSSTTIPVEVTQNGALQGRTVTSICAGGDSFFLYRCRDGTAAASGWNPYGQLGNGTTSDSKIPVQVSTGGVLNGKSIGSLAAGYAHVLALCTDGTPVAWGSSNLGTNSPTSSSTPVATVTSGVLAGKAILSLSAGINTGLALCTDGSVAAWGGGTEGALGNGGTANSTLPVATNVPATGEKFSALAKGSSARHHMAIAGFPLSNDSSMASILLSSGTLSPLFSTSITSYTSSVTSGEATLKITAVTSNAFAMLKVNGVSIESGKASPVIPILPGDNTISITVTAETGATTTYTVTVTRPPLVASFDSEGTIATTVLDYSARGNTVELSLHFPPAPGTILTIIHVTDPAFIDGEFVNLAQGQHVSLNFGGINYDFVANYFGGTGNDLVLQWAGTQAFAWGSNGYGQVGDNSTAGRLAPVAVEGSGALSGKTITAVAEGYLHSLALCSDGTLAAWGYNVYGQLGNGSTAVSNVPLAVDQSGVLAEKTVIAISAGPFHNLALCSDGTLAAWGYNNYGQLGTGDKVISRVPVRVVASGALAGKQVVGIAAAAYQSFARCADGTLVAWGYNDEGELGNNSTVTSVVPVAVDTSGALAGKKVVVISAGQYHTLALCADGTAVSWGYNKHGELGNNTTISSKVPVAIGSSGALAGKVVIAMAAGWSHSLALCSDGTLVAWGSNAKSQLGVGGIAQSLIPVTVDMAAINGGKSIARIAAGGSHSLAHFPDGRLAAWGDNSSGQLGNNGTITSPVPSLADTSSLEAGARIMFEGSGSAALHNLAVVANPLSPAGLRAGSASQGGPQDDPDHDGIPNLVEYAFGLDPLANSAGGLPKWNIIGNDHVIRFSEPAGVSGITYGAESSATLLPDSWSEVPDTGIGAEHVFSVPAVGASKVFFRLKVIQE